MEAFTELLLFFRSEPKRFAAPTNDPMAPLPGPGGGPAPPVGQSVEEKSYQSNNRYDNAHDQIISNPNLLNPNSKLL